MHIHFIQHEAFEDPAAFLTWAESRNHEISITKVFEYQALPSTIDGMDMLVVMGGPQSPATTLSECPHFDAEAEKALIRKFIRSGKFVLGVCLGAQLIGSALGADFEHSPEKEIGVFPIQLTDEGLKNKMIQHFDHSLNVGHWHSDMPGLTADAKILATSAGCPRQIIAYSERVYGFQCHLELTTEAVEPLIANDEETLSESEQYRFVQSADEIRNYNYTEMNEKLFLFLDKFVAED